MWCCCSDNSTNIKESFKEKLERYCMSEIEYNTLRNSGITDEQLEACFQEYSQVNKFLLDAVLPSLHKKTPTNRQDSICKIRFTFSHI